jgi:hypothetical protein
MKNRLLIVCPSRNQDEGKQVMKTEIEQQFEKDAKNIPIIREHFKVQVVRWAYSLTEIWSYEDKRLWTANTDFLSSPDGAFHACGYDALERPVVLLHYDFKTIYEPKTHRIPLNSVWCEEFIVHADDGLEVRRIVRGKLERISWLRFQGHRQSENKSVIQGVYQHTLMHYERTRIKLQQSLDNQGRNFFEIHFDPNGQQSYFRVRRDGSRFQLYQPLPKGITVRSLKETVRNRLIKLVPELVLSAGISEPIYCVALVYDDEGNDALPPLLGIGLESERKRWEIEHGKRAKEYVWNPAEFQHYEKSHTQLSDEAMEEACDYLNGKWAEGSSTAPAAKLLMEIAAALNHVAWPTTIQRTEDFVVYAVGLEGSGLRASFKVSLCPEKLARLKSAGLF